MNFPTTPGSNFDYRGETYYVISAKGKTILAETTRLALGDDGETTYGSRKKFYNMKPNWTTEYRVMEYDDDGEVEHGYKGDNEGEARASLKARVDRYGKYGRKFELQTRHVSDWSKT